MARRQHIGTWAALALVLASGFGLGRWSGSSEGDLPWRTATGYVGAQVLSVTHDGWTYGARDSIPRWVDAEGSWHDGGWPECLDRGERSIRFVAGPLVRIEGIGERTVLAVDCRG